MFTFVYFHHEASGRRVRGQRKAQGGSVSGCTRPHYGFMHSGVGTMSGLARSAVSSMKVNFNPHTADRTRQARPQPGPPVSRIVSCSSSCLESASYGFKCFRVRETTQIFHMCLQFSTHHRLSSSTHHWQSSGTARSSLYSRALLAAAAAPPSSWRQRRRRRAVRER